MRTPATGPKTVNSFRDLLVWQKAIDLVVSCYELAKRLPANEEYGLASQIRRSAVSIPANIAEGRGRKRTGDYLHHLSISNGSLMELETHLLICVRLSRLKEEEVRPALQQADEIGRMLAGLTQKLDGRSFSVPKS